LRRPANYIGSALLFMLLILPLAFILFLQGWQLYLTYSAKERLEEQLLETIIIRKDQFRWQKKGKEISIDGKMFDVKSFITKEDKIIVTGIYDYQETAINSMLAQQFGENHLLIRLLALTQFFFFVTAIFFHCIFLKQPARHFYFYANRYKNICRTIFTPPPRLHFHS
jgi:hypothetical protein